MQSLVLQDPKSQDHRTSSTRPAKLTTSYHPARSIPNSNAPSSSN